MTRRQIRALCYLAAVGAALLVGSLTLKGCLTSFWHAHSEAVVFGGVLCAVYLVLLLVFARTARKRLLRVRAQRDRARRALEQRWADADMRAADARAYRPCPTSGVPVEQIRAEFDNIMYREFIVGGDR
ncbi:hypothetical protein ABT297_04255 [Dactylosporangium sp. NPDC000555]|uniref:hypothetical protein n=1 Tax=Dactylosporangium sp. NPDC000555 TaxID=3154260 RepID=UPI00332E8CAA